MKNDLEKWAPKLLQIEYQKLLSEKISLGDDSDAKIRKLGFRHKSDFQNEHQAYIEAIFRLGTDQRMKNAWEWLIENDTHITAVFHIRCIARKFFTDWRKTAKLTRSDRKKTYLRIEILAKKLAHEVKQIEFEEDTPINEANIYLMNHPWIGSNPTTRENIHTRHREDSIRVNSLLATAQNLPSLSVLLERIEAAAKQGLISDEDSKKYRPTKIGAGTARRTFAANFFKQELGAHWENTPTYVLTAITGSICDDLDLDDSTFNKLISKK